MTKEELKQESEEYVKKILEGTEFEDDGIDVCAYTKREMLETILHFAEPREKRIAELEKENTELKERNRELLESCEGATMMYKDLCKAKRYIKELLRAVESSYSVLSWQRPPIQAEAEQFINSEVGK